MSQQELKGKVAVVTGASKGIGAQVARRFGEAGAAVVVNYASDRAGADRVAADIQKAGGKAIAVQGSVVKARDVQLLFAAAREAFGPIDVLVNNAGVYKFSTLDAFTEEDYRWHFDTNVLGLLLVTQEALKHFNPAGGSVINISSVAATNPSLTSTVYSATKGAVDTITVSLARELGPRKIRVNGIAPGGIATEGTVAIGVVGGDFEKLAISQTPLGRFGQPDDVAGAAAFLASDLAKWVSGETIRAAGGWR